MDFEPHDATNLADALERQVEAQGEAAKRAIREYKKTIRHDTGSERVRQNETRREVENAVHQYLQLCRRLDELRTQITANEPPQAG